MLLPDRFRGSHTNPRIGYFTDLKARAMGAELDLYGLRKDGEEFPIEISLGPIETEEGMLISSVIHDVTRRKHTEEKLRHTMADLERSNEELERFASVASHDLAEPLRAVSTYCQLISNQYGEKLDAEGRQFLAFAVDGARRMTTLIKELLEYSSLGSQPKPFQETDFREVVNQAIANLEVAIRENEAQVTIGTLPTVRGDFNQLVLLFQNLLSNALKYRNKAAPPRIHVSAEKKGSEWTFSVQDNGIGIQEEHFSRIFDIFRRLHSQVEYSGTGIGLATCRKIVENHRGKIWVDSKPGKGSTFFFSVPNAIKEGGGRRVNQWLNSGDYPTQPIHDPAKTGLRRFDFQPIGAVF